MSSPCVFKRGHHHNVERNGDGRREEDIAEAGEETGSPPRSPFVARQRAARGIRHHDRHGPRPSARPNPHPRGQMPARTHASGHMDRRGPGITQREADQPQHPAASNQRARFSGAASPTRVPVTTAAPEPGPESLARGERQEHGHGRRRDTSPEHAQDGSGPHIRTTAPFTTHPPSSFQKYAEGGCGGRHSPRGSAPKAPKKPRPIRLRRTATGFRPRRQTDHSPSSFDMNRKKNHEKTSRHRRITTATAAPAPIFDRANACS